MSQVFIVLLVLAMAAVLASLVIGLFFMTRQNAESREKSNKWMRIRVMLQGFAIIMFLLAVLSAGTS